MGSVACFSRPSCFDFISLSQRGNNRDGAADGQTDGALQCSRIPIGTERQREREIERKLDNGAEPKRQ